MSNNLLPHTMLAHFPTFQHLLKKILSALLICGKYIISFLSAQKMRLSLKEQSLFAKRLSLLVKAGVPILASVQLMERQAATRAHRAIFQQISHDVAHGQFLFKSIGRFQNVFGDFAINVIRVGEMSGSLSDNLKYLAQELDKKRLLHAKVMSALIYPLFVMIAAFLVSGLMTVYLFPKLLPLFKSLNVQLPLITRILIHISGFLLSYWFLFFLTIIISVVVFIFLMRGRQFHFRINQIFLKIPFVGALLIRYHLANLCRTFGNLLQSNIRVLEAAAIAADTSTNLVYQKALHHLHDAIARGSSISAYLNNRQELFPPLLTQLISIAEQTGHLGETLLYLGELYEQELDEQIKRLSSVAEPCIMIVIGIIVGIIALSIITPIYEVTRHLNPM